MPIPSSTEPVDYVDLPAHALAYHRFMLGLKWISIHLAAVVTALVVALAARAGIIAGVVAGLIVFGVGVYAMRHGLAHSTERDNEGL